MVDTTGGAPQTRRRSKAPGAFRTIGEVATDLEVPQHVLRFWESKFAQVKPLKRGGGRRYYRPEDVDLLRGIRHLLYSDGYTIKGVQKLLREIGSKSIMESGRSLSGSATAAPAGAAGVAAARTRRQGGTADAADPSAPAQTAGSAASSPSASADGGDGANTTDASGASGLTAVQRGKLTELAAELGELRDLLRRPAAKD
ncbi:MAG: MerR family transcriptional regulator [Alphaproteobacteria bacterium]|jgi:DNA-binding transcriptional MerR regulator|nr:MerR family transcriptional regulator [Alphaproteobacteria bacterium]MDP6833283.1 MerR family transcriptional regulator [Alphaproteobacteria bacterium]